VATSYLDADAGSGGDGSLLTPWNTLPDAETNIASWDVLKIKRGTSVNLADYGALARFTFSGKSDKTITTYYNADGSDDATKARPIFEHYISSVTGDWTEVSAADPTVPSAGSNFWVLDGGTSLYDPIMGVWFGPNFTEGQFRTEYWSANTADATDVIPANVPAQLYQYDSLKGHATLGNNLLGVYSVGNPVTSYGGVYWADINNHKAFDVFQSSNIIIENLHFKHMCIAVGLRAANSGSYSDNIVRGCLFESCARPVYPIGKISTTAYIDNAIIEDNEFLNIIQEPIYCAGGTRDIHIRRNTFTTCGVGYTSGAVYFNQTVIGAGYRNDIYDNTFTDIKYGRYYNNDGGCIETDYNSNNIYIYENKMFSSHQAWHDNSGQENWFYGNLIDGCDQIFQSSDSTAQNGNKLHVLNNTGVNLSVDDTYNDGTSTPVAAMQYSNIAVLSGSEIKNNIISGSTGSGLRRYDAQAGNISEDYNCYNGFVKDVIDENSIEETIGSNGLSADPLLNADGSLQQASPCVGVGVKWWTGTRPVGFDGEPFPDWDIDIGGSQSLFGPFHPVNL